MTSFFDRGSDHFTDFQGQTPHSVAKDCDKDGASGVSSVPKTRTAEPPCSDRVVAFAQECRHVQVGLLEISDHGVAHAVERDNVR